MEKSITFNEADTVLVRRQWNDYRTARYRLDQIDGVHWDDTSGGVFSRAPRPFLHGYVSCDGMTGGQLPHSCEHGRRPHSIKVCIVKKDNRRDVIEKLIAMAEANAARRRSRGF